MNTKILPLNKLPLNKTGFIYTIQCSENVKRRLLDLGIIKNTCIKSILKSPSGGLKAFAVRGSLIAIRDEDSSLIQVYIEKE